jgi:hypothetical protein
VSVVDFVAVEVGGSKSSPCFSMVAGVGYRASVSVIGVEVVIDMAVEVGGAVKPRAGSDKGSAAEPLRTIVSIRGAAVGSGFVIAVGAIGSDPDADVNLGLGRPGRCSEERKTSYSS